MELLKNQIPLLYVIIKTLWDILSTVTISAVLFCVIFLFVWMLNRMTAAGG